MYDLRQKNMVITPEMKEMYGFEAINLFIWNVFFEKITIKYSYQSSLYGNCAVRLYFYQQQLKKIFSSQYYFKQGDTAKQIDSKIRLSIELGSKIYCLVISKNCKYIHGLGNFRRSKEHVEKH